MDIPKQKLWRKTLYENTGYEDNYTDASFLKDMRTNLHVRIFSFHEAVVGAARLNSHFNIITGFLIIFCIMYNNLIPPTWLLIPSLLISIMVYIIICMINNKLDIYQLLEDSKTLITVLLFGYLFAPLLHTLTGANSTDTIFYVTFFVMLINLISHDYGLNVTVMPRAISVTAAIFGSICLVSRLSTSYHAFVLLVISVIFFVLFPMLTTLLGRPEFSLFLSFICSYVLYFLSPAISCVYIITVIFLHFICPWIFVSLQKYKHNIHGPWDEAMVKQTDDI